MSKASLYLSLWGCFGVRVIAVSIYCLGVFHEEIRQEFGISNFEASALYSIANGLLFISGLFVPMLLKKFTERQIIILGGLVAGLSVIASYFTTSYLLILILFSGVNGFCQGLTFVTAPIAGSFLMAPKHHHISIGIQMTGDGLGIVAFSNLLEYLIEKFTWRSAILLYGAIILNFCVCGASIDGSRIRKYRALAAESEPVELKFQTKHLKKSTREGFDTKVKDCMDQKCYHIDTELFRDVKFVLLLVSGFFYAGGIGIFFSFSFAHFTSVGLSSKNAAWCLTALGITSILTRFGTVVLDNRSWLRRWAIFVVSYIAGGILFAAAGVPDLAFWGYLLICAGIGLFAGANGGLTCCVVMDIFGPNKLTEAFGYLMVLWGFGSVVGPLSGGLVRDMTGSYTWALALGGLLYGAAGLILLPLACMRKFYETVLLEEKWLQIESNLDKIHEREDAMFLSLPTIPSKNGLIFRREKKLGIDIGQSLLTFSETKSPPDKKPLSKFSKN